MSASRFVVRDRAGVAVSRSLTAEGAHRRSRSLRSFGGSVNRAKGTSDKTKGAGFAIGVYSQDRIESNAEDRFGPKYGDEEARASMMAEGYVDADGNITEKGWDVLNEDVRKLELNSMTWLRKKFVRERRGARSARRPRRDRPVRSEIEDPAGTDRAGQVGTHRHGRHELRRSWRFGLGGCQQLRSGRARGRDQLLLVRIETVERRDQELWDAICEEDDADREAFCQIEESGVLDLVGAEIERRDEAIAAATRRDDPGDVPD